MGLHSYGFQIGTRMNGYPLSPTIFNVVVDAVVCHWVTGAIEEAEARGVCERREDIRRRYFMQMMAWSPRLTPAGYRAHLTPWLACLIGWACGQMLGRHSAWSVTPVRQRGTYPRQHTGGGSRGWDLHTGSG